MLCRRSRLPWADLGLGRDDAWGNRFRYRVDEQCGVRYANRATGFVLGQGRALTASLRTQHEQERSSPAAFLP